MFDAIDATTLNAIFHLFSNYLLSCSLVRSAESQTFFESVYALTTPLFTQVNRYTTCMFVYLIRYYFSRNVFICTVNSLRYHAIRQKNLNERSQEAIFHFSIVLRVLVFACPEIYIINLLKD